MVVGVKVNSMIKNFYSTFKFKDEQKDSILQKLTERSLTMEEATGMCSRLKNFEYTKYTFLKEVGLSWEDAVQAIPQFTDEDRLGKFSLKPSKELTSDFKVINRSTILYRLAIVSFFMHDRPFANKQRQLLR